MPAHAAPREAVAVDPDQDILDLVARGDLHRALRHLMDRHGDAVYRYICKALADEALAADVHQRVFIEACRDLSRFAGRSQLRTWLFGITRHRVLDAVKQDKRARRHLDEGNGEDVPDPGRPPGDLIDAARLLATLERCLEKLGDHVREAVLLRHQQGFSFEELAQMTGEKSGTLQARVARAFPVLRKCIEATTGGAV